MIVFLPCRLVASKTFGGSVLIWRGRVNYTIARRGGGRFTTDHFVSRIKQIKKVNISLKHIIFRVLCLISRVKPCRFHILPASTVASISRSPNWVARIRMMRAFSEPVASKTAQIKANFAPGGVGRLSGRRALFVHPNPGLHAQICQKPVISLRCARFRCAGDVPSDIGRGA